MPPFLDSLPGYIPEQINANYGDRNPVIGNVNKILSKRQTISTLIQDADYNTETVFGENGRIFDEVLFRPTDDAGETITGDEMQLILQDIRDLGLTFHLFSKNINIAIGEIKLSKNKKIVSINTFPEDLAHPDLIYTLNKKCRESGVPHENIIIEILEYSWINRSEEILKNLKLLKKNHYKIALDDLVLNSKGFHLNDNENHSCEILVQLVQRGIPLDYIKIYGGFLQYLSHLPINHHDVIEGKEELIQILQEFKIPPILIAEWVNTRHDIQIAQEIGCSCFQGRELLKEKNGISSKNIQIQRGKIIELK
ncbi:EAL domain-containing protein [Candidatus Gracilibacteria bacterium 28_42_T64]|nr:EAL domain-containing protein [Candidatus Gracilibacteria bacterium 28_42_T64]